MLVSRSQSCINILLKPSASYKSIKIVLKNITGIYKRTEFTLNLNKLEEHYQSMEKVSNLILHDEEQYSLRKSVSPSYVLGLESITSEIEIEHQLNYESVRLIQFDKI